MTGGETALLRAVRTRLQAALTGSAYEVNIEIDEQGPATAAQKYVAIVPGGFSPGSYHNPSGGIYDFKYAVDVFVVMRITNVPRDRERDAFMFFLESVSSICEAVIVALDYRYDVTDTANVLLAAEQPGTLGFIHPLVLRDIDPKPRVVPAEVFGAGKETRAGMSRRISFGNAHRVVYRTAN